MDEKEITIIYVSMMALKGLTQTARDLANLNQYVDLETSPSIIFYKMDPVFCTKLDQLIKEKVETKTAIPRLMFLIFVA